MKGSERGRSFYIPREKDDKYVEDQKKKLAEKGEIIPINRIIGVIEEGDEEGGDDLNNSTESGVKDTEYMSDVYIASQMVTKELSNKRVAVESEFGGFNYVFQQALVNGTASEMMAGGGALDSTNNDSLVGKLRPLPQQIPLIPKWKLANI